MSTDGRAPPPPDGWSGHRSPDDEHSELTASGETLADPAPPAPDSVTNITNVTGHQRRPTMPPSRAPLPSHPTAPTGHPAVSPSHPPRASYPPPAPAQAATPPRRPYPSHSPAAHPSQAPPAPRERYPSHAPATHPSQAPPPPRNPYPSHAPAAHPSQAPPPPRTPYPSQTPQNPPPGAAYRSQPAAARPRYASQPALTPMRPPYPSQTPAPLPPPPSQPLPAVPPPPASGPAPVPPPPPPVFGTDNVLGPPREHVMSARRRQPSFPQLGSSGPDPNDATQKMRAKRRSTAKTTELPGMVLAPDGKLSSGDAPPPLPDDHPSQRVGPSPRRKAPKPPRDDLPPPSERTATFVGIVGEPLPFGDEPDPSVRKRALLRLGSPSNHKSSPLDPPAVLRTFRSLSAQFDEDTKPAIDIPLGGVLPFEPNARYTITLGGIRDTLASAEGIDAASTFASAQDITPPGTFGSTGTIASTDTIASTGTLVDPLGYAPNAGLPLPFSAGAGDTPELVKARDEERLGQAKPESFNPKGDTLSDPPNVDVHQDPLPFRARGRKNRTLLGIEDLPPLPNAARKGGTLPGIDDTTADPLPFEPGRAEMAEEHTALSAQPPRRIRRGRRNKKFRQTVDVSPATAMLPPLPFDGRSDSRQRQPSAPQQSAPPAASPGPPPAATSPTPPAAPTAPVAPQPVPDAIRKAVAQLPRYTGGASPRGPQPVGVLPPNPLRPNEPVAAKPISEPPPESTPHSELQPLLNLELYARVKVGIWDRALTLKQALAEHDIDEMQWRRNEERHAARIAAEAEDGKATFAKQVREAVKRVRAETEESEEILPIDRYAELRVMFELADHEEQALADSGYTLSEWEHIKRSWSKRLRGNRSLSKTLRRAMAKARRQHRRTSQAQD